MQAQWHGDEPLFGQEKDPLEMEIGWEMFNQ
jgi:hypothetical protein